MINIGKLGSAFMDDFKFISLPFLPYRIALASCKFNLSCYSEDLFEEFNIVLPMHIKNAVKKRQAEYLAGRYVAIKVLSSLNIKVDDIPTGVHRNPIWPNRISASITHTNTKALCVAAHKHEHRFIGVDLENRLPLSSIVEIKSYIINEREENLLKKNILGFEAAFILVYSAKESLFKALYPSVGYYFDFTAAEVTEINANSNCFHIMLLQDLTADLKAGMKFKGYFNFDETGVFTIVAE